MRNKLSTVAWRTALLYAAAGAVWILFSDALLTSLVADPTTVAELSIVKGWGFVLVTALLLYVFLHGQLRRLEREVARREQVEVDLRRSRDRQSFLAGLIENAEQPVAIGYPDGRIGLCNRAFCDLTGYSAEELKRTTWHDTLTPPEWIESERKALADLKRTGRTVRYQKEYFHKSGRRVPIELLVHDSVDETGDTGCFYAFVTDITERKQKERLQLEQSRVLEQIAQGHPLRETLEVLIRAIEAQAEGLRCSILLLDKDGKRLRHAAAPSLPDDFNRSVDGLVIGPAAGSFGVAAHRRETVVSEDVLNDPLWVNYVDLARSAGLRSCWSTPIFDANQAVLGTFAVYRGTPGRPTAEHLQLINAATHTAAICISSSRGEEALHESEQRFRELFEQAADAIFVESLSGHVLDANAAACRLHGLTHAELVGKHVTELVPPEARTAVQLSFSQLANQSSTKAEGLSLAANGHSVPVEITAARIFYRGETALLLNVRDITERKAAEAALARNEELYRTLFELCPDGILLENGKGAILDANQAFCRMSGYSREELRVLTVHQLSLPDRTDEVEANLAVLQTGATLNHKVRSRRKDGSECLMELHEKPIALPEDQLGILVIAKDVTDRSRAEERLRFQEALLRETGQIAKVGGWSFDPSTGEGYWTEEVARIHDLDPAAQVSRDIGLQFYQGESRQRIQAAVKSAIELGASYDLELELVSAAGRHKWVRTIGNPVIENGRVVRVRGSFQDITERKNLEAQLRQSQKMDSIGRLAGGVAHDFNNILTIIQGNASMLLMPTVRPEGFKEHAQQIIRASERAAGLTRQLLLFSRKQVMQPANLNLNELVMHTIKMLQRILGEDITLETRFAPHLGVIHADPGMIDQVLMNLAVNSRDAMPKGGCLLIATSTETVDNQTAQTNPEARPGVYACLTVTDSGCGISPENLSRVFDPFFTTKEVGKGTGLGLATVYGIVKQHSGWITVESVMDQGTVFRIYLPTVAGAPSSTGADKAARPIPGGAETILVVEDETSLRRLMCDLLQGCGYTVLEASSGQTAMTLWEEKKNGINLLLTDMVMPGGVNGCELATRLQQDKPGLKVICASGYSADAAAQELFQGRKIHFLPKPFDARQLGEAVRNTLDGI